MPQQIRSCTFTVHTGGLTEIERNNKVTEFKNYFDTAFPTTYWCMGEELGMSGTTPHYQGFAAFKKRVSFKKLATQLKCHIEAARGSAEQNRTYCSKEGGAFHEYGTYKPDTAKFDTAKAIQYAREGRVEDIAQEAPQLYLRYRQSLERVQLENHRPLKKFKKGFYLVGAPGTGKTRFTGQYDAYIKNPNKWCDGYTNEGTLVVDELGPDNAPKLGYWLKRWADWNPILSEVKTSHVYLDHSIVFITSNYRINTLYSCPELRAALHRRYKEIVVLEFRETPIGMIEIKTYAEEGNPLKGYKWLNQFTILDLYMDY